jgi:potassium-transporting ATPase KdpC subunit
MSTTREIFTAIRMTLVLWVVTAIAYPLLILGIGQVAFPNQANGSLVRNEQGTVIGSALIGQPFTSDEYFLSRPSVIDYSVGAAAAPTGLSGASNFAPSNPDLIDRIETEVAVLKQADITPTADLVYTSGSGLDPHITPSAALAQVERVATARALDPQQLQTLINDYTEGRFLGIFGEPGVNVLRLNQAVDHL